MQQRTPEDVKRAHGRLAAEATEAVDKLDELISSQGLNLVGELGMDEAAKVVATWSTAITEDDARVALAQHLETRRAAAEADVTAVQSDSDGEGQQSELEEEEEVVEEGEARPRVV